MATLFDAVTPPLDPADLTVTGWGMWQVHWGGINYAAAGGLEGQVTALRLPDGLTIYVRENVRRDHFYTCAGERQGMKRGDNVRQPQVLELCCPAGRFAEVADLVRRADSKNRPVRPNRQFTVEWAKRHVRHKGNPSHD